jgi:hypothetical protein
LAKWRGAQHTASPPAPAIAAACRSDDRLADFADRSRRAPYRANILPQCSDEALYCVQTGLLGVVEPGVEFIGAFASKNAAEAHGELTPHNEIRRCTL